MANLHLNFRSDSLMRSVYPVVFLPDYNGWNDVQPPYRTLYFLPGYSGGGLETATFTNFSMYAALYGVAIVLVDGENSFYVDDELRGAKFSQYVGQEIVDATRALLPLSHKREDTYIGGISMGGFGAAARGLHAHETFSKILMMSPAIQADMLFNLKGDLEGAVPVSIFDSLLGGMEAYKNSFMNPIKAVADLKAAGADIPKMYMCCGVQDVLVYDACAGFREEMEKLGVPLTYVESDGMHTVPYWDEQLEDCFKFLADA